MPRYQSFPERFPGQPSASEGASPYAGVLPYLRKVYALFSGGIAFAIAGGLLALYAGTSAPGGATHSHAAHASQVSSVHIPPIIAFALEHRIVMLVGYFGAFFAATALRRTRGLNVAALFGYTFVTGLFLAPAVFYAQLAASHGTSLDPSPVRDAFLLTGAAFVGLTSYVFISRKDFSYLGASLSMGLWVVIGASLLGLFVHSAALSLAIASVGVLLFSGYILYDTSRLLRSGEDDAVSAALSLFLDVVNLFMFLLRILSSNRSR